MIDITGLRDDKRPQSSTIVHALLDRLEAAEKERDAAELMSLALRAKIEQMEKQEPVAWMLNCPTLGGDTGWILSWTQSGAGLCNRLSGEENEKKLYALPGAQQPAPSVPDGWLHHAARMAALARKLREPDWHFESIREMQRELCALEEAALAAAPEVKP